MLKLAKVRRQAFSLTESAILLGIVGLVLSGVWVASSGVTRNFQDYETDNQLSLIVQNIRKLFGNTQGFSSAPGTDITAELIGKNIFPSSALNANGDLTTHSRWRDNANHGILLFVGPENSSQFAIRYQFPDTASGRTDCFQFIHKHVGGNTTSVETAPGVFTPTSAFAISTFSCPLNLAQTQRMGGLAYNLQ
jgi:type II secretory pathway pseudopilin PulG